MPKCKREVQAKLTQNKHSNKDQDKSKLGSWLDDLGFQTELIAMVVILSKLMPNMLLEQEQHLYIVYY